MGILDCTCIENFDFVELRNWLIFLFASIGAFITIKTFISSTKQRKIDNTFKTLDFLRKHIGDEQIKTFIELFDANNELSGVKFNEFKFNDGRKDTIEDMFSEGGCGNGDIHNMIEIFNLISPTLNKLEIKIIWFEYGQFMSKIYDWTEYLDKEINAENSAYNLTFYLEFNKFMKRYSTKLSNLPMKVYVYAE